MAVPSGLSELPQQLDPMRLVLIDRIEVLTLVRLDTDEIQNLRCTSAVRTGGAGENLRMLPQIVAERGRPHLGAPMMKKFGRAAAIASSVA